MFKHFVYKLMGTVMVDGITHQSAAVTQFPPPLIILVSVVDRNYIKNGGEGSTGPV